MLCKMICPYIKLCATQFPQIQGEVLKLIKSSVRNHFFGLLWGEFLHFGAKKRTFSWFFFQVFRIKLGWSGFLWLFIDKSGADKNFFPTKEIKNAGSSQRFTRRVIYTIFFQLSKYYNLSSMKYTQICVMWYCSLSIAYK